MATFTERLRDLTHEALQGLAEKQAGTYILFDPDDEDTDQEDLYDLPAVERVSKHGFFMCYRVLRVVIPASIENPKEPRIELYCVEDGESGDYETFDVSALSHSDLCELVDRLANHSPVEQ